MNEKHLHFALIILITILVSSCNPAPQVITGGTSGSVIQNPIEEMLSYIPRQWIDQHPPELVGPTIYYLDFDAMSHDLNLPDVTSKDSREEKLPLLIGLATQGLPFTPPKIDPLAGSSFANWGWDVADASQALYIPNKQVAIIKGIFSESSITTALTDQNYSSTQLGEFTIFSDPNDTKWFAVTSSLLVIGSSHDELQAVIQQKSNPESSADDISHLRQLLSVSESPHGLLIVASGDLLAMDELMGPLPPALEDLFPSCPRQFDWDLLVVAFRSADQYTQMDISYSFPSEQDAIANLQVVHNALTQSPSDSHNGLTWADLITVDSITVESNLVIATATTRGKLFLGTVIESRYPYGFLPARKLDPYCPLETGSS